MNTVLVWIVSCFGKFYSLLDNMMIVSGVSVLSFVVVCFVMGVLINQLVRRAS